MASPRLTGEDQTRKRQPSDELGMLRDERCAPQLTVEQRRPEQLQIVKNRGPQRPKIQIRVERQPLHERRGLRRMPSEPNVNEGWQQWEKQTKRCVRALLAAAEA